MQCVGAVGTALQAATLFGGPTVYRYYRRARAALGLSDTSVAAQEARQREAELAARQACDLDEATPSPVPIGDPPLRAPFLRPGVRVPARRTARAGGPGGRAARRPAERGRPEVARTPARRG